MVVGYTALIRSALEYGRYHIQCVQKIDNRLLRIVGMKMGFSYGQVSLGFLQVTLVLKPLATRQQLQDVSFLSKVVPREVDCHQLLDLWP